LEEVSRERLWALLHSEEENTESPELEAILERRDSRPDQLIEVLQDMQAEYQYLPEERLRIVSQRLGAPPNANKARIHFSKEKRE
jgi:NADH:ubiquinone oxidoreductase subunit E